MVGGGRGEHAKGYTDVNVHGQLDGNIKSVWADNLSHEMGSDNGLDVEEEGLVIPEDRKRRRGR